MLEEFHTYSIVARDPDTGQLGVAVQSHAFGVGRVVSWAHAGVGAVATQAVADASFGPLGLERLRAGQTAPQALQALLAAGDTPEWRQVALVDAQGNVAAHTGARCIEAAGHRLGAGYSVQANMMARDSVWGAMAAAYESASGDLAERLLAALEAAEREGGDLRGMQSAALVVVEGKPGSAPWQGRLFDLRVDDHPQPLAELRRLVRAGRASHQVMAAMALLAQPGLDAAGRTRLRAALAAIQDNLDALRGNPEPLFWYAVGLAGAGLVDEALPLFGQLFTADACWRELLQRLPAAGRLPDDPALLARLLAAEPRGA